MESGLDTFVLEYLKHWGGHSIGVVIALIWLLNKSGIWGHFSKHRLAERRQDARERKDLDDRQDSLMEQLRGTLNELDERCREERIDCDRRIKMLSEESSFLHKALVEVLDYAALLWTHLDAAKITVRPPPNLEQLKSLGD